MDFKTENINLSLQEKNKQLMLNMKTDSASVEKADNQCIRYAEFMKEKEPLLQLMREIEQYSLSLASGSPSPTAHIKSLSDVNNFKNRIIMTVTN